MSHPRGLGTSNARNRSKTFYRVYSAVLLTDLVGPPVAYGTLQHSLWLPYVVCGLALLATYPILLYMPETLQKTPEDEQRRSPIESTGIWTYLKFLKDWRILVGITTVFLAQFRNNTIEILLPYTSVRFGLKLGEVTWNYSATFVHHLVFNSVLGRDSAFSCICSEHRCVLDTATCRLECLGETSWLVDYFH
jgi:hypothetical protein